MGCISRRLGGLWPDVSRTLSRCVGAFRRSSLLSGSLFGGRSLSFSFSRFSFCRACLGSLHLTCVWRNLVGGRLRRWRR